MTENTKKRLVLGTFNRHKVEEITAMLGENDHQVICLADFPEATEAEETGTTFEANGELKAIHAAEISGELSLADDSGLCIDALDGRPGVYSCRYAPTNEERITKVLEQLKAVPEEQRTARFVCVMALADADGNCITKRGTCEGRISFEPKGSDGFGYDPVFFIPEKRMTMAEITAAEKNKISHRANALVLMKPVLIDVMNNNKKITALSKN